MPDLTLPLRAALTRFLILTGMLWGTAVWASGAIQAAELTAPVQPEQVRLCYFDWNPYATPLEQDEAEYPGNADGLAVDIIQALSQRLGFELTLEEVPYKRCLTEVVNGNYHGTLYYVPTLNDRIVTIDHSFMGHYAAFVVPADSHHRNYRGLHQFSGETVSVLRGGSSIAWLSQNPAIRLYKTNRVDYLWPMLRGGRVAASIVDWVTLLTQSQPLDQVRVLMPIARYAPTHIGLNASFAHWREDWANTLKTLWEEGIVDAAYQRRLGLSYAELQALSHNTESVLAIPVPIRLLP